MNSFLQILAIFSAGIIVWILYRTMKGNPETFSRENMNKSFYTAGILALILIAFVALLVILLRMS